MVGSLLARISHQAAMDDFQALQTLKYMSSPEKQCVLETPIPALASPGPAALGLHSIWF